jgi:uncharacterized membrane protein
VIKFQNAVSIDRPINEVFAFLSDFENVPKWNYFVLDVAKTSDGPVAIGTTYHQIRKTDEQDFRVIEFEPNHKVAVKTLPRSSPQFERRFTFQMKGSTTHVIDSWNLDTGQPSFVEKLAAGKVKSAVAENLSKLKRLLETRSVVLQDGNTVIL